MIELIRASFCYKGTDVNGAEKNTTGIHDVSLTVGRGEFVVLAGGSGCGKTTITRLVNGLVPHYFEGELEGEVRVCGEDIREAGIGALAAHVGSVFQNPRSQFFNVDTTSEMAFVNVPSAKAKGTIFVTPFKTRCRSAETSCTSSDVCGTTSSVNAVLSPFTGAATDRIRFVGIATS